MTTTKTKLKKSKDGKVPLGMPQSLIIFGKTVTIEYRDDPHAENWGDFNEDADLIVIQMLGNDDLESTLFHECVHAALAYSGLNQILDDRTEEAIVRCIENALYPLFVLNK